MKHTFRVSLDNCISLHDKVIYVEKVTLDVTFESPDDVIFIPKRFKIGISAI